MDTPYERLDEETRKEWMEHPTTIAYLATVQGHHDDVAKQALTSLKGSTNPGFLQHLQYVGGILAGLDFALALPTKGRK